MDNLENQPSPTAPEPSQDNLQAQVASVASLLNSVLILLFVLSGGVDYYLFRQASMVREDIVNVRGAGSQILRNLQAVEDLARKLNEYARTHPDFAPIATKYNLQGVPATPTGTAAPVAAPTNTKTKK